MGRGDGKKDVKKERMWHLGSRGVDREKGRWKIAVGLLFVQPKLKRETAFERCLNSQSATSEYLHTFTRIQRRGSKLV